MAATLAACSSAERRSEGDAGFAGGGGAAGGGTSGSDGGGVPTDAGEARCEVPTDGAALVPWLREFRYRSTMRPESQVHVSTGPHGGNVRTYVTPSVVEGLGASPRATELAECSAMVKELYGSGRTTVEGWAVAVKTAKASGGGASWYWYELLRDVPNARPVADGRGVSLCVNCHRGGSDFVLSPIPLQ